MPKPITCPGCHKPIAADAAACPACGRPAPDGGGSAPRHLRLWEKVGLGAIGAGVVGGALALIVSGGRIQQTEVTAPAPAGWTPHSGETVQLKADAISCPQSELFDALHGKLAALQRKARHQAEDSTGPHAGVDGCFAHGPSPGSVKVLKLSVTQLGLPVAKIRGQSGAVWWVRRQTLAKPQPEAAKPQSPSGSQAAASRRSLRIATQGRRAD
ncbi:MAG: hypothetical protein WCC36_05685 [Gammaproteobacteria bacterium]